MGGKIMKWRKFMAFVVSACLIVGFIQIPVYADVVSANEIENKSVSETKMQTSDLEETEDNEQETDEKGAELVTEDGYGLGEYKVDETCEYYIYNRATDTFLTNDGSRVIGSPYSGNDNQKWICEGTGDGVDSYCNSYTYNIKSKTDGRYMNYNAANFVVEMAAAQTEEGTAIMSVYKSPFSSDKDGELTGYKNALVFGPIGEVNDNYYPASTVPVIGLQDYTFMIQEFNYDSATDGKGWWCMIYDPYQIFELIEVSGYIPRTSAIVINPTGIHDFVSRMYTVALGREAESAGLADWTGQLSDKKIDGAGIANGFINSEEFKNKKLSDSDYIDTLYKTFFNRSADSSGKNYWLEKLSGGVSRTEVLSGFVNSEEFSNLCDSFGIARGTMQSNGNVIYNSGVRDFCERIYTKALDRNGETLGVEEWTNLINVKAKTPADVAYGFFNSQEFINKNYCDGDYIDILYQTFMGRPADIDGKIYWISKLLQGGMSRNQVLESFAGSQEFRNIMTQYGL